MANPEAGEMEHDLGAAQDAGHRLAVADIRDHQLHPIGQDLIQVLPAAVDEIVDRHDLVAARRELADELGSDEPRSSGDDDHPPNPRTVAAMSSWAAAGSSG